MVTMCNTGSRRLYQWQWEDFCFRTYAVAARHWRTGWCRQGEDTNVALFTYMLYSYAVYCSGRKKLNWILTGLESNSEPRECLFVQPAQYFVIDSIYVSIIYILATKKTLWLIVMYGSREKDISECGPQQHYSSVLCANTVKSRQQCGFSPCINERMYNKLNAPH